MDYGGAFDALLTDLFKIFDCIPYDFFIAKLEVYGFQILFKTILFNRKHRVKINETFSFLET